MAGLTLVGVCMLHCSEVDWVRESIAGYVMCEPAHTEYLCQWPSVLQSVCYVGERFACRASKHFIFVPLLHGFNNPSVSSAVAYSCLLFSMCNAYAEMGLLVLMYRVCSLCLVATDLPDCPTYEFLQVLHLSLYMPLEFVLVLIILSVSCWCIVFVAFKLVCLKRLVIFVLVDCDMRMLPIFWFVVLLWLKLLSLFFWLSVSSSGCEWYAVETHYLGYCKYDFPFLLFSLFCDW